MPRHAQPEKPYSRHRTRQELVLPAEGVDGPAPKLPGGRKWSAAERRLWRELWSSPQAFAWEDSAASAVALYLCHLSAVLSGEAAAWQAAEARHLAERLGLTPSGLQALGWRISEPGEVVAGPWAERSS